MKAATVTREIDGLQLEIPVGSMDPPSARSEQIMKVCQEPGNWKMPVGRFSTFDRSEAEDYAYCLNWYCGGHEWSESDFHGRTCYHVSSQGYYHYVGA